MRSWRWKLTRRGRRAWKAGLDGLSPEATLAMEIMTRVKDAELEDVNDMLAELVWRHCSPENAYCCHQIRQACGFREIERRSRSRMTFSHRRSKQEELCDLWAKPSKPTCKYSNIRTPCGSRYNSLPGQITRRDFSPRRTCWTLWGSLAAPSRPRKSF